MPDWLQNGTLSDGQVSPTMLVIRLLTALVLGGIVSWVYRLSHGRDKADSSVMGVTLVLLAVLIAMVSLVIGNNVARAFSLVGTLSIVRFRTVVDDTRDTAFVIFAVIVGMAVGGGQFLAPMIGIPIVSGAALVLNRWNGRAKSVIHPQAILLVRLGLGRPPDELLNDLVSQHAHQFRITTTSTARQGAALDITYSLKLKSEAVMTQLVSELNQVEGVLSVELRLA